MKGNFFPGHCSILCRQYFERITGCLFLCYNIVTHFQVFEGTADRYILLVRNITLCDLNHLVVGMFCTIVISSGTFECKDWITVGKIDIRCFDPFGHYNTFQCWQVFYRIGFYHRPFFRNRHFEGVQNISLVLLAWLLFNQISIVWKCPFAAACLSSAKPYTVGSGIWVIIVAHCSTDHAILVGIDDMAFPGRLAGQFEWDICHGGIFLIRFGKLDITTDDHIFCRS